MIAAQLINPIIYEFTGSDLKLINDNTERFDDLMHLYEEEKYNGGIKYLFKKFCELGIKEKKTKEDKLEFLAVYYSILNHSEMYSSLADVKKRVVDQMVGEGLISEEDNDIQIDTIVNDEEVSTEKEFSFMENITKMEKKIDSTHKDLLHKLKIVSYRKAMIDEEYVQQIIAQVVNGESNTKQAFEGEAVYDVSKSVLTEEDGKIYR